MTLAGLPLAGLLAAGAVVAVGALIQGSVGFGLGLFSAPVLVLIDPVLVPVPLILLGMTHASLTVLRDRRHTDWHGVGWALVGRLPGTALGVLAVAILPQRRFGLVVGLLVLAFVLLSLLAWRPRPRPRTLVVAGVASGTGATAVGIGGPPLALIYQHSAGPRVRATLATVFVTGAVVSLASLAGAGQVSANALLAAGVLIPFMVAGFALSGPARHVLDAGWTRRAVLTLATASAVFLIVDSLLG